MFAMPLILGILIVGPKWVRSYSAMYWDQVEGRIILSEIDQYTRPGETTSRTRKRFRYYYEYQGKPYQGRKVTCGGITRTRSGKSVVEEYPAMSKVTVYVNPKDPSEAVLIPDFRLGPLVTMFFFFGTVVWLGCKDFVLKYLRNPIAKAKRWIAGIESLDLSTLQSDDRSTGPA